jgi:hypothetical protein
LREKALVGFAALVFVCTMSAWASQHIALLLDNSFSCPWIAIFSFSDNHPAFLNVVHFLCSAFSLWEDRCVRAFNPEVAINAKMIVRCKWATFQSLHNR